MTPAKRMPPALLAFVFAILAFSFTYGCIQPSQAERCASVFGADKDKCLNETAIGYQEPYICYSISDMAYRQSCLEKSVDPQEAQKMQQALIYGQSSLPEPAQTLPVPPQSQPPAATAPSGAVGTGDTGAQIAGCQKSENISVEACTRMVAIEQSDIALCENITDSDYRSSCISNIALAKKDASLCGRLKNSADANICKYYTSGG